MSSSFVRFGDHGFEADDSALEVWLMLLIKEIDKANSLPDWLQALREEWWLQATEGFGFGVTPNLDGFVTDEYRRELVLTLCHGAQEALRQYGDLISADALNALHTGGEGAVFTQDVPAEQFLRTADYFIKLLQGSLSPSETDARFPA